MNDPDYQPNSVLESLYFKGKNPKLAVVMAMDMLIAGVDTVTIFNSYISNLFPSQKVSTCFFVVLDIKFGSRSSLLFGQKPRETGKIVPRT